MNIKMMNHNYFRTYYVMTTENLRFKANFIYGLSIRRRMINSYSTVQYVCTCVICYTKVDKLIFPLRICRNIYFVDVSFFYNYFHDFKPNQLIIKIAYIVKVN